MDLWRSPVKPPAWKRADSEDGAACSGLCPVEVSRLPKIRIPQPLCTPVQDCITYCKIFLPFIWHFLYCHSCFLSCSNSPQRANAPSTGTNPVIHWILRCFLRCCREICKVLRLFLRQAPRWTSRRNREENRGMMPLCLRLYRCSSLVQDT